MNRKVAVLFLVSFVYLQIAYSLECYHCNERDNRDCNNGAATLKKRSCPNRDDQCETFGYEVIEDGRVVTTGYQRGCQSEMGSCRLLLNFLKTAYSSIRSKHIRQKACHACDSDLCNTKS